MHSFTLKTAYFLMLAIIEQMGKEGVDDAHMLKMRILSPRVVAYWMNGDTPFSVNIPAIMEYGTMEDAAYVVAARLVKESRKA